MQFGFRAPVAGPLSGARDLARIVSSGEAMGYDYCTISDHVIRPRDMEKKYPYTDTGELPQPQRAGGDLHEQLTPPICRRVGSATTSVFGMARACSRAARRSASR